VRARIAAHLSAEAADGGYVAEAAVAEELRRARRMLGGLLGFDEGDVAFLESGSAALAQLLASWPLQVDDSVWVAPSEWGPNLAAFADRGLHVGLVDVDDDGVVDQEALSARLALNLDPPSDCVVTGNRALSGGGEAVCVFADDGGG
jgi:pyridoxal 5-phosphate dependent beta-lyase